MVVASYVFAILDKATLKQDPRMKRKNLCGSCMSLVSLEDSICMTRTAAMHEDFVILTPQEPISWLPSKTFWSRVSELPPVEYFTGFWDVWEAVDIPGSVANAGPDDISVFVVPRSQYDELDEQRDSLTELRQSKPGLQSTDRPSVGASPSTFRSRQSSPSSKAFEFNRPKSVDHYPIPISLLQPEFARFKEDLRSVAPEPSLSPLAWSMATELSALFPTEAERESCLHEHLAKLFGSDVTIKKRSVGTYKTDGGIVHFSLPDLATVPICIEVTTETSYGSVDGVFELLLYYNEGVRHVLLHVRGDCIKTRLPSILIFHNGPNIQVYGGLWLSMGYIEVLSHSIPLHFNNFDTDAMEDLLRFLTALRHLYLSLCEVYRNPLEHVVDAGQIEYPYVRTYPANIPNDSTVTPTHVPFTYTGRISRVRLVFTARTADRQDIIIKFGSGQYGVEAHQAAAAAGIAPELLSYSELPGGMWMVAIRPLPAGFEPCQDFEHLPEACQTVIKGAVSHLHSLGYVHGDVRDSNVFVSGNKSSWACQLIDFDWSGRPGEVRYPRGVFRNDDVWRPREHMDGDLITLDDDIRTMSQFLDYRTMVERF